MKIRVVCPSCSGYLEKEVDENEVQDNLVLCGKCKVPAVIYNAETGEAIAGGSPCISGVVVCAENSDVQAVIPDGLSKEEIVQSLRFIAGAIESDSSQLIIAKVDINLEDDKMIIIKTGSKCPEANIDKEDRSPCAGQIR
jgi:hypothetical protein